MSTKGIREGKLPIMDLSSPPKKKKKKNKKVKVSIKVSSEKASGESSASTSEANNEDDDNDSDDDDMDDYNVDLFIWKTEYSDKSRTKSMSKMGTRSYFIYLQHNVHGNY